MNDFYEVVECEHCGAEHSLESVKIKVSVIDVLDQNMKVTWFKCDSCKQVFVVSIEDSVSYDLKVKYDLLVKRLDRAISNKRDEQVIKDLQLRTSGKLKALVSRSDAIIDFLNDKGSFTLVATENNSEELIFTAK